MSTIPTTDMRPTPGSARPDSGSSAVAAAVPWTVWAVVFASTSVVVGVIWDISWHRTIGRDTFWTPAHLAIYLGGVVAGLSCGWLVLRTTFATAAATERAGGVSFWGFRGPLGAWVCIWGSFAMILSGPFDDWWHNAYGLDVEILSPPHTVLAAGIIAIQVGAMLMVLSRQNNTAVGIRLPQVLYAYAGGVLVLMMATMATEYVAFPNGQRRAEFYLVSAGVFPLLLAGITRGSLLRWGATLAAGFYMAATLIMIWILQLFPAEPLLGPILRDVDSMVAPPFPLLLVVPAAAVDVIVRGLPAGASRLRPWLASAAVGAAFVALILAVQWTFSSFLLGEGARNFFFAADQWDYNSRPGPWQYEFWGSSVGAGALGWSVLIATLSARVGLWWGDWMVRVRR